MAKTEKFEGCEVRCEMVTAVTDSVSSGRVKIKPGEDCRMRMRVVTFGNVGETEL